jgi:biopolymer transport protein ExbD
MNKKRFDQINMIPFIDIMLVLLTIVLTTATFVSQGLIPIDLPQSETSSVQTTSSNNEPIEITITSDGKWFYNQEELDEITVAANINALDKNDSVLLKLDKKVEFSQFVKVQDMLRKRGLANLQIVTETLK